MAALGINVSDREPIKIFNNKPRFITQPERDYRDAADNAERRWKFYSLMVDEWAGDNDAIDELADECRALDHKASMRYKQLHCAHENTHVEGRQDFIGGAYWDNTREVCDECEAKVLFHRPRIAEPIVEIP